MAANISDYVSRQIIEYTKAENDATKKAKRYEDMLAYIRNNSEINIHISTCPICHLYVLSSPRSILVEKYNSVVCSNPRCYEWCCVECAQEQGWQLGRRYGRLCPQHK